ncbi:MAG TPA: Gfo/Idh/MocA family oxidoreductase [Thermoanaerobaculia bacterium]|nr:Gfo/Idh/MocA family oxidoreductase [Thermoanaerobaculia bacterium]
MAIVGAGGISPEHLAALKTIPEAEVVAVADRAVARAQSRAREAGIPRVCEDVRELYEGKICDVAHVLVPPDLHRRVAEPLLEAGIHVLVEKPLATTHEDCEALIEAARRGGALLGVNQNMLFNPAYLALKRLLANRELGGLRHLIQVWNVPLAALTGRKFDLWMFREPQNILLEQAVHPFSQVVDLGGRTRTMRSLPGGAVETLPGRQFYRTWQIALELERCSAQVLLSFGEHLRSISLTAVCDDGVARADFDTGRLRVERRSRFFPPFGPFWSGLAEARSLSLQSLGTLASGVLSGLALRPASDPFQMSMRESVKAFYAGLETGKLPVNGRFGAEVVGLCEEAAREVMASGSPTSPTSPISSISPIRLAAPALRPAQVTGPCEVALFGGGGLIGKQVLRRLLSQGTTVRVLLRSTEALPDLFREPGVQVVQGDAERDEDVDRVVRGAKTVADLVYPKEGEEVDRRMIEGARRVAESCLRHGVERLVYVSSIAALFPGRPREVITGGTGCDPRLSQRNEYSRGKAESERLLLGLHRERGLPVSILRPAIVVGGGAPPFHGAIGQFVDEQHCLGWSPGTVPLPFVLAEDVAEAICLALRTDAALGRTYNLVGDVRLNAREYLAEVGRALGRPLRFHPRRAVRIQAVEVGKWLIKRLAGRRDAFIPSYRDLRALGMQARFDCADVRRDLGWQPVADREEFLRRTLGSE